MHLIGLRTSELSDFGATLKFWSSKWNKYWFWSAMTYRVQIRGQNWIISTHLRVILVFVHVKCTFSVRHCVCEVCKHEWRAQQTRSCWSAKYTCIHTLISFSLSALVCAQAGCSFCGEEQEQRLPCSQFVDCFDCAQSSSSLGHVPASLRIFLRNDQWIDTHLTDCQCHSTLRHSTVRGTEIGVVSLCVEHHHTNRTSKPLMLYVEVTSKSNSVAREAME